MLEEEPTKPILPQQQRLYATVDNPTIHAAIKSLFSFENEKQAYARLKSIKKQFVTSKQAETNETSRSIILWILGYDVSEEEAALGYKGNFACLSVAAKDGDKSTIIATKIQSQLSFHPQRNRRTGKHPDWGHPILRDIYKKRIYFTLEEASNELTRLHEEYPTISIPAEHRLFIIVYGKIEGAKSPVQKYKFTVRPIPDGGFIIDFQIKIPRKTKIPQKTTGFFSEKEKIRRTLKPKRSVVHNLNNKIE